MHRIDGANATTDSKFSLGNPGAGIPATTVTADILNALQEELCGVIESAGITLDKNNNGQLLAAIRNLGFSTGDGKLTLKTTADLGWVLANDGTIGSAASGATTRANADTAALYTLIWTNITNTNAPIYTSAGAVSTRGASAAADFAANKRLALTKTLGRALALAGAGAGLTMRELGAALGQETVTLTQAQTPVKSHTHGVTDPGHTHGSDAAHMAGAQFGLGDGGPSTTAATIYGAVTGITINAASDATATPHENMPPVSFWNAMIKL